MSESSLSKQSTVEKSTDAQGLQPPETSISIGLLLLDVIGMALVVFAGYEIYLINEKQTGILAEYFSWPHYPWVIMGIGVLLMIPFHKQVRGVKKQIKQYQKEVAKKNKPDF